LSDDLKLAIVDFRAGLERGFDGAAAQRQRFETQLANTRTLFGLGDIDRDSYVRRREELSRQLAGLRKDEDWEAFLVQAAALLTDLPAA
jgi:hypothetical protein